MYDVYLQVIRNGYFLLVRNAISPEFSRVCAPLCCVGLIAVVCTFGVGAQSISFEFDDTGNHIFTIDEQEAITKIANKVVIEVRKILPELPSPITLTVAANTYVVEETGEMGMAPEPGRVAWTVDPSRSEGVKAIAKTRLRATLFHELHHLARGYVVNGGAPRTSFMDVVVSEGMATAFERDFADANPAWGAYPDDVSAWVEELLELPLSALGSYSKWMFEHPDGRRWIGYKAGTFIVDQAMAASGMTSAELVHKKTREVLELAGIDCN